MDPKTRNAKKKPAMQESTKQNTRKLQQMKANKNKRKNVKKQKQSPKFLVLFSTRGFYNNKQNPF